MKKLKPNKNNIETYLPIFSGFYGSIWSEPNFYGEAEHYNLPDNFDFSVFLNWNDYYNALSKYFCNCVETEMNEFIEIIEFQTLQSPNEKLDENHIFEEANSRVYIDEYLSKEFYDLVEDLEETNFINRDNVIEAKRSGLELVNLTEYIELIKKFVRENYDYSNIKSLTIEEFANIETGLSSLKDYIHIEKIIDLQISDIEKQTLELKF